VPQIGETGKFSIAFAWVILWVCPRGTQMSFALLHQRKPPWVKFSTTDYAPVEMQYRHSWTTFVFPYSKSLFEVLHIPGPVPGAHTTATESVHNFARRYPPAASQHLEPARASPPAARIGYPHLRDSVFPLGKHILCLKQWLSNFLVFAKPSFHPTPPRYFIEMNIVVSLVYIVVHRPVARQRPRNKGDNSRCCATAK
jgi:hypothetical protein